MRASILATLLCQAMPLVGCDAPAHGNLVVPPLMAAATPAGGFAQLKADFRAAHEARDVPGMEALVYQAGVEAGGLDNFRASVTDDFGRRIRSIDLAPIARGETFEYMQHGRTWRPNVKPVGWLKVSFEKPTDAPLGLVVNASSYLVGVVDGRHRIGTAAAVR